MYRVENHIYLQAEHDLEEVHRKLCSGRWVVQGICAGSQVAQALGRSVQKVISDLFATGNRNS